MNSLQKIVIETPRLKLIAINHNFAQDIFDNLTFKITRYMFPLPAKQIEETIKFINSSMEKQTKWTDIIIIIIDKKTWEFLWWSWAHNLNSPTPELWIRLKEAAHWKKYWSETIWWLIKRINENYNYEYLIYPVDKDNIPSRKLAEKFWWIIEKDENWNIIIEKTPNADWSIILNIVKYRILKN